MSRRTKGFGNGGAENTKLAAQPGMNVRQLERDLGITPGLLYKWRQRFRAEQITMKFRFREVLLRRIRDIFEHSRQRYASPRVRAELCTAA